MQDSSKSPQIFLWLETVCNSVNSRGMTLTRVGEQTDPELESR
jgi:hypothetical protein